ncbi:MULTISPECIES: hypothetical protein [Cysteiniphilum]|uniref:Uncharacterized protein n=1 Tax=Cysteiniphilum litorale TaxID=2056700 RepID=A0A8J2Z3D5_9GAMM|nr:MULTISPECIES: hypothetical protein [Cysteiniphilum]GGF93565.1 hypothetical protein GCM10010995_08400 [Cysteiniphilum litorale]
MDPRLKGIDVTATKHIVIAIAQSVYPFVICVAGGIGFIVLLIGCFRLTKHGKAQQMFRYYAPSTTFFMIFSGVVLVSITNFFQMLTASLFPTTSLNPQNTLLRYMNDFSNVSTNQQTVYVLYSVLMIVGLVSLTRSMILLTKVSEGQEGHLGRTLSHMLAGIIAMNAEFVVNAIQSIKAFL